jgi:serine protease Do
VLLACMAPEAGAQAAVDTRIGTSVASRVLRVEATNGESGRVQLGSGVVVARQHVATSCHVTRGASQITVVSSGLRLPATAQRSDLYHDLCVIEVPQLDLDPVPLAAAGPLQRGDPLLAVGYTGGAELRFSVGVMTALYRMEGGAVILSSNAFSSGASGGGLFDAEGRLRGLLTFRQRGQRAYYSVAVDWLLPLLDPARPNQPIAPQPGLAFWEPGAAGQAAFLRADTLRREGRWSALVDLARHWARSQPDDPQALHAWSDGLEGLGRYLLHLDPGDAAAWWQRGALLLRLGRRGEVRDIVAHLRPLDNDLADRLDRQLETR